MPKKKKMSKKADPPKPQRSYIVAKCNWCGMQWKHYDDDTPPHVCGKVCQEHYDSYRELMARTPEEIARDEEAQESQE